MPDRVFGRSLTMKIFFGAANGPMTFLTWSVSSFARAVSSSSYVNSLEGSRVRIKIPHLFISSTYGFRVTKA